MPSIGAAVYGGSMKRFTVLAALCSALLTAVCGAAPTVSAATISTVIGFTANAFDSLPTPGTTPPFTSISGTIDVTFDPALTYNGAAGEVTSYSLTTTPGSPSFAPPGGMLFYYTPGTFMQFQINPGAAMAGDVFALAVGLSSGSNGVTAYVASGTPGPSFFDYAT